MRAPDPHRDGTADPPDSTNLEVLPEQTSDDLDVDWREGGDAEARLLEERPPHWD